MDEKEFIFTLEKQGISLSNQQLAQFEKYYELLFSWNKKVNLTSITEKKEVYLKHFYDSISPAFYFSLEGNLCDIGAGAGFPSLPLLITNPAISVTIVDSLKKRIHFLDELVTKLELDNVNLIHARAEDVGKDSKYREQFSVVTARAVARMSVLSELCLPLCKVGGSFIALKGANAHEEMKTAVNANKILGGETVANHTLHLPIEDSERTIIQIRKVKHTPKKYPRKAGTPAKTPL